MVIDPQGLDQGEQYPEVLVYVVLSHLSLWSPQQENFSEEEDLFCDSRSARGDKVMLW